ncbi:MAG: DUF1631 domain-containing protein [Proteobacteria bacterium]|nr:DUF1631 domain-containing protein [Pseudomonadota bacterium]
MPAERLPQTLAERADLPARARTLLEEQLAEYSAGIEPQLRASLTELEQELFKLAEQARSDAEQQTAFESLREVKRTRADAAPRLLLLMEGRLAGLGLPQVRAAETRFDLALIEHDELEEAITLDDIATHTEMRASQALFELGHRYAVLAASPLLETEALPLGPHALVQGLHEVAGGMGLPREHRTTFYRLFDRRLLGAAEVLYGGLNKHLALRGILPNLRSYLPRRNPESQPRKRGAETSATPTEPLPPPPAQTAADAVMGNLRELLEKRRSSMGEAANEPTGGYVASGEELQTVLAGLQTRAPEPVQMGGRTVQRTVQHLQQDMLAELRRFSPDGRTPQFSAEHRDTLDLIALLFDRLMDETRSGGSAQRLLSRLQVPLLRAALADRSFFTQRAHPARRLLNTVAETANTWMDTGEGESDTVLGDKLHRTVDRVLGEFSGDLSLFEKLVDELEAHVHTLKRRAEMSERRQLEAAQGRDRLEQARASAASAIQERLAGRTVPPLTRALLEQAWCDALALANLRHGEDSEAFHRRLAAADELLREPEQRDNERLRVELQNGLEQIGLQGAEASQLAHRVLDLPHAAGTPGETASQTELAMRLKARQKLGDDEAAKQENEPALLTPLNAEEQRALAHLKTVPFGTWFEFTINQQGQRVPRKLAWYTPATNRCLFVSARGTAGPERKLEQVARLMALGQVRLQPQREESLIDRAWNSLVAGLRQFGMAPRAAAAAT